jgi:hypothetical protein
LVRADVLGKAFSFDAAVLPSEKLIGLFQKVPIEAVAEFPEKELKLIQQQSDAFFKLLTDIQNFDPNMAEAATRKSNLVTQLEALYQPTFSHLYPLISFSMARTVNFNELATQGNAAVQGVRDETSALMDAIARTSEKAEQVLADVRDAAAEQGVTQQARFFESEAKSHNELAGIWETRTRWMTGFLLAYAVSTLAFPVIPLLSADSIPEAIQLTVSKILIFFVLGSTLLLCVRNFIAHKHNGIVNRHRQNALLTYTTLAEAGNSIEARDTVLQHAAAAIYAPNDTGYVKNEERGYVGGSDFSCAEATRRVRKPRKLERSGLVVYLQIWKLACSAHPAPGPPPWGGRFCGVALITMLAFCDTSSQIDI